MSGKPRWLAERESYQQWRKPKKVLPVTYEVFLYRTIEEETYFQLRRATWRSVREEALGKATLREALVTAQMLAQTNTQSVYVSINSLRDHIIMETDDIPQTLMHIADYIVNEAGEVRKVNGTVMDELMLLPLNAENERRE